MMWILLDIHASFMGSIQKNCKVPYVYFILIIMMAVTLMFLSQALIFAKITN